MKSSLLSLAAVSTLVPTSATSAFSVPTTPAATPRHTLYDVPVSNNGARCRIVLYKKGIPPEEVTISSPQTIGGLKGDEYMALNPQGKMPLLTCSDPATESGGLISIPESDTICRYLLSAYSNFGPSFLPNDVRSNLIARLHDVYLSPIQGCMYKAAPPFGPYGIRSDALDEYRRQMRIIDDVVHERGGGAYLCGSDVSLGDAALFPSVVFARYMLPKFGVPEGEVLPPKIGRWYDEVKAEDEVFSRVHDEIWGALQKWDDSGRWDTIWLAGARDDEPGTIFDKIVSGDIPASVVWEDDKILAFKDINPAAPAHVLVIPKVRGGLVSMRGSSAEHVEILGRLLVAAGEIAGDGELGFGDGARVVINDGGDGGQEVPHLHVHVLGGRKMGWPPG